MSIKRHSFLIGLAVLACGSVQVMAADMPLPMYQPYSWTGFYGGADVGWHWSQADITGSAANSPTPPVSNYYFSPTDLAAVSGALPVDLRETGIVAGAHWGFNYQLFPMVVIGAEGDLMGLGGSPSASTSVPLSAVKNTTLTPPGYTTTTGTALLSEAASDRWMTTLRLRGGLSFDRVLVYGTGGAAIGRWNLASSYADNVATIGLPGSGGSTRGTAGGLNVYEDLFGWTAGAGIEYAFGQNWTARLEYLYANFGTYKNSYELQNGGCSTSSNANGCSYINYSAQLSENIVRFGLSYVFH